MVHMSHEETVLLSPETIIYPLLPEGRIGIVFTAREVFRKTTDNHKWSTNPVQVLPCHQLLL